MRAYVSIGRLRFAMGLQYRTAALAGVATQLFFGLVFIMVYVAFYRHGTAQPALALDEVVSYIWLQQMFLSLTMLYLRDHDIFTLITGGNIAYELCRPTHLYGFWYAKVTATRVASATLRCLPLLPIVLLLPPPYRLGPPDSPAALALFAAALLLGLLLVCSISLLIYISIFWTLSPTGSLLFIATLGEFLSGMVVPIPLMPGWAQAIAYALPFRWTVDFPYRVYTGNIGAEPALAGLAVQAGWLCALVALGLVLMRGALRRVVVQGG